MKEEKTTICRYPIKIDKIVNELNKIDNLDKDWADSHDYCIWKGLILAAVVCVIYVLVYNLVCK